MIKEILNNKKIGETELGFGNKNYNESVRFLNKDGSVNIKRKNIGKHAGFDAYHWMISTSWTRFIVTVLGSYLMVNTLFAFLYYSIGATHFGGIRVCCKIDDFLQLFFFSAQTLTTVGYGHIYPNSTIVSSVSSIESLVGLLGFALATGILYGRFSRPKADIEYSNRGVIAPYENITAFMFRIANRKQYELIENECKVVLAINNLKNNKREFHNLKLEIANINFLPFSWTIVHPITTDSPMYEISESDFNKSDPELIILFKAINDTYSQSVYSRVSYKAKEIDWNSKFVPIKQVANNDGSISINLTDIHKIEKL